MLLLGRKINACWQKLHLICTSYTVLAIWYMCRFHKSFVIFYPTIAYANIRSQLEYASSAWSPWLKQDILEIKKVQRRVARFMHNNYWPLASVTQMLCTLDWETLETRCQNIQLFMLLKDLLKFDHILLTIINRCLQPFLFFPRQSATGTTCPHKLLNFQTYIHSKL